MSYKAPRHVYFGPKDPLTGEPMMEPEYVYRAYPKTLYRKGDAGTFETEVVNSADEHKMLGDDWHESPAAFGVVTAPDVGQQKARAEAERLERLSASKAKKAA